MLCWPRPAHPLPTHCHQSQQNPKHYFPPTHMPSCLPPTRCCFSRHHTREAAWLQAWALLSQRREALPSHARRGCRCLPRHARHPAGGGCRVHTSALRLVTLEQVVRLPPPITVSCCVCASEPPVHWGVEVITSPCLGGHCWRSTCSMRCGRVWRRVVLRGCIACMC
jgi:hypothetical protein